MLWALRAASSSRPVRPLLALVAGVLALHLALLARWGGARAPPIGPGAVAPPHPVVVLLPRERPPAVPLGQPAMGPPVPPAAVMDPPSESAARSGAARPPLARAGATAPSSDVAGASATDATLDPPSRPAPDVGTAPPSASASDRAAAVDADDTLPAAAPTAGGLPPPLYPVRLPAPARLRYALHYFGRAGEALLDWRPSDTGYSLYLHGLPGLPAAAPARAGAGKPLIEQTSQGQLDGHGLAPERFTDRRRGRAQRAANFNRSQGRIEFSVPAPALPDWPGAQDRLSWWVQLPAIVAAADAAAAVAADAADTAAGTSAARPAAALSEVTLFVVDARGRGEHWRFQPVGRSPVRGAVQHWRHEPDNPEGQRVELWLDPAQGHWPVQLRLTLLRSGDRLELRLLTIDPPPS